VSETNYPLGLDKLNAVSQVAAQELIFRRLMAGTATAKLVKVLSCTNAGGEAAVGSVSVQPLVNQIDGSGNVTPHGTVYALPYFRLQGGSSAIIIDPVAGDLGVAIFCDRDISSAKRTKGQANPGSRRMFDMADGLYIGGFLNALPVQYLQFLPNGGGINIVTPGPYTVQAQGNTWTFGAAGFTMSNLVVAETHVHAQPNDSAGDGEEPTYGPMNP
jgi:hypothetical protein